MLTRINSVAGAISLHLLPSCDLWKYIDARMTEGTRKGVLWSGIGDDIDGMLSYAVGGTGRGQYALQYHWEGIRRPRWQRKRRVTPGKTVSAVGIFYQSTYTTMPGVADLLDLPSKVYVSDCCYTTVAGRRRHQNIFPLSRLREKGLRKHQIHLKVQF